MGNTSERPQMYVLAYDPRKSQLYHALYAFFAQTPNVAWWPVEDPDHALKTFHQIHPAICYVNLRAPESNIVLKGILNAGAPFKPEVVVSGKPRGIEAGLIAETLPQLQQALHVTELKPIRVGRNVSRIDPTPQLEEIILRARNSHLDELAAHGTDAEVLAFYKELEPNQKADLAISTHARVIMLHNQLRHVPEEGRADLERLIAHKSNYVKRLMSEALDAPDKEGKETFRSFTTEGGGVSFPRIFVKFSSPERARHLAKTYNFLRRECPSLRVPAPDPEIDDYAVIEIGDNGALTVVSAEQVAGPTYRRLLRERRALLDNKDLSTAQGQESEFSQLLCDELLRNAVHDLAVFHAVSNNAEIGTMHPVKRKVAESVIHTYLNRMADLSRDISTYLRTPETDTRLSTLTEALKAFSPFDPFVPPGEGVSVGDRMFVANRDCSPANMALSIKRPPASDSYTHALLDRVRRSVQRHQQSPDLFKTGQQRQHVADAVRDIVRDRTYHFDFGYRQGMPCLWGEDIAELLLDHDWLFDVGETDSAAREFTFESIVQRAVYDYALQCMCASHDLEFDADDAIPADRVVRAGREALTDVRNNGVIKVVRKGWFSDEQEVRETDTAKEAQKTLTRNGGHNPAALATHIDWMRYYRSLRGASHALARWRESGSNEPSMPVVQHYLHQSIVAMDRLRKGFYDRALNKRWMFPDDAAGNLPAAQLNCEEIFADFDEREGAVSHIHGVSQAERESIKADYHMLRLNTLAALSRHYCHILHLPETPWKEVHT